MKIERLTLPITILLSAIILAGGYYVVQYNKQQSIEKQQRVELEAKAETEALEREQEHKEYVAKRKLECYEIYKERDQLKSNVDGYFYREKGYSAFEEDDVCVIRYENPNWKEGDPLFSEVVNGEYKEGKYFTKEY